MSKGIQSFQFIFTGQQYLKIKEPYQTQYSSDDMALFIAFNPSLTGKNIFHKFSGCFMVTIQR